MKRARFRPIPWWWLMADPEASMAAVATSQHAR